MLSLIIPTFNERDNIQPLYERVRNALGAEEYEIIFVDDSVDETTREIARLAAEDPRVRLLHRRERGLSTAVIAGFGAAQGDLVAVMDADLQHPPEILPQMLEAQRQRTADLVVPSRYIDGGNPGGLDGPIRRMLSLGGRALAHLMLRESRATTDPMSGYFLATREAVLPLLSAKPKGFKILLELLVRGRVRRTVEVPYTFAARSANQSKLGWKTQVDYLRQLLDLVPVHPENTRFFLFALVGATGVAVNAALFALLTSDLLTGVEYAALLASPIASNAAIIWNFAWNTTITWRDRYRSEHLWRHAIRYVLVSEMGTLLTWLVLVILRSMGLHFDLLDQLIGIGVAVLATYRLNDRWTYLPAGEPILEPERSASRR